MDGLDIITLVETMARKLLLDPSGINASNFLYRRGRDLTEKEKDGLWRTAEDLAYATFGGALAREHRIRRGIER